MKEQYNHCLLCARRCGADRNAGRTGVCGVTAETRVARAALHMWEEPCISGPDGSGTVFFAGCSLGCVFCQNRSISRGAAGRVVTTEELAGIFLGLREQKANNINLVTPTHYAPAVIDAVRIARDQGLAVPIVYNTGTYETVETVSSLKETVDVFMPDLKYFDPALAEKYAKAPDYFATASAAIAAMREIAGPPVFDERGMMKRGVLVRHLIIPGHTKDSKKVLEYLSREYGKDIYVSIMNQYTPMAGIENAFPELGRKLTKREYDKVVDYAIGLGIENAFIQEGGAAKESFIPEFMGKNPR